MFFHVLINWHSPSHSTYQALHGFLFFLFFNCYLAAPRRTLGHYWGSSLTNPMLITAFDSWFDPKITRSLVTRLGLRTRSSPWWSLIQNPSDSQCNALTHSATLPNFVCVCLLRLCISFLWCQFLLSLCLTLSSEIFSQV